MYKLTKQVLLCTTNYGFKVSPFLQISNDSLKCKLIMMTAAENKLSDFEALCQHCAFSTM